MKSYPSTTVISSLHIAANSILCARIKHRVTNGVLTVCGVESYFASLLCQGEINQSVHNHQVELILASFDRHLCSILHDKSNAFCFDQAIALTDKQGFFGDRRGAGHLAS
jgi:hypothetical protein